MDGELVRRRLADVKHVLHHGFQPLGLLVDDLCVVRRRRGQVLLPEELRVGEDGGQGGFQVVGDVAHQLHLHPFAAGLLGQGGPHPGLDVVEALRRPAQVRVLREDQGPLQVPGPDGLHLVRQGGDITGQPPAPPGAVKGPYQQHLQKAGQEKQAPSPDAGVGPHKIDQDGHWEQGEDKARQQHQQHQAAAPAEPLLNRPLQVPCPEEAKKSVEEGPPDLPGVVLMVVAKQPPQPVQGDEAGEVHQGQPEDRHAPGGEGIPALPVIAVKKLINHVQIAKARQEGPQQARRCQQEADLRPDMDRPRGDFPVHRLHGFAQQGPENQAPHGDEQQQTLGIVEGLAFLHLPGEAVKGGVIAGAAGFVVGAVVRDGRFPDGHDHLDPLQLFADREVVVAGDKPPGIAVVVSVSVYVPDLAVLEDRNPAVHKLKVEVVPLHGPGQQLVQAGVHIAVDLPVLYFSVPDVIEDVLVRLIGRVRLLLRLLLRLRWGNGLQRSLLHPRGFRSLAKAPPGPNGLLLHHHRAVVAAVPVVRPIVEVHRSPGSDGQKLPEIVGNLVPEGVRLLPVPLPPGRGVPLPGDPVTQRSQGGEGQRHSQEEGQKTGQRLDPPAGAEDLHALPRLHGLPDLLRHKLLQGPAGVLTRAVPICIQCPTPP